LLVGLTAQSLSVGPTATVVAFGLAAVIFVSLLIAASFMVSSITSAALKPIKMTGPAVRRFSGYVLLLVGGWFIVLAFLPTPIIGS
jgi:hypothetical protein